MAAKGRLRLFWLRWSTTVLLLCVVGLTWCAVNHLWTAEAWATPLRYQRDALGVMARAKSYADGEILPVLPKFPASFGAPFKANWNDHPSIEEAIYAGYGLLAWIFGVFIGSNVALLLAHLLAAGSFYFVCRRLRYDRIISALGAALFALSPYAFARGLGHLALSFYWHVPLGLLVVWWCLARAPLLNNRGRLIFCLCVSLLHAVQNPYYAGVYCQFLIGASFCCAILRRPWPRVFLPLALAATVVATAVAMDGASILYRFSNGANLDAIHRSYKDLELYALKPVELFVPFRLHREQLLGHWGYNAYEKQALFIGESWSVYIGILAISSLIALSYLAARAILLKRSHQVPSFFWYLLWLLLYSVVGGVNGLIGLSGFVLFRATNRYSIVIMALLLFFLVQRLTLITRPWPWPRKLLTALCLLALGIWDQTSAFPNQLLGKVRDKLTADDQLVTTMESKLPHGAMVFQLPVVAFPEAPSIHQMTDYHQFRPYLHSTFLHYSYGSNKGRPREKWQSEVEQFTPAGMVNALERYGFSAILIARSGYVDGGTFLLDGFQSAQRNVLAESKDFICVGLQPVTDPLLPAEFDASWHRLEGDFDQNARWSKGDAQVVLYNGASTPDSVVVEFALRSVKPRHLEIWMAGQKLSEANLPAMTSQPPTRLSITLQPGRNILTFRTDRPAEQPPNGDPRFLAFCLLDFRLTH
jgi:phosphoglycerol transferase